MKPGILLTSLLCCLTIHGWSQQMVARYDPGLKNTFLAGYALNDTTYRVFSHADDGNSDWYSSFIVADFIQGESNFLQYYDSLHYPPFVGTYELTVIPLSTGDAMLAGNFFDCDLGSFAVTKITPDYQVEWHLYSYELGSGAYQITRVGLVAPDVVVLETDQNEQIYISFAGDVVYYPMPPPVYRHPLFTTQYIFGFHNGQWLKFNYQFQALDSIAIDTIVFVAQIGAGFLIQSGEKMLLVDSTMQVVAERELLPEVNTAIALGNDRVGVGNPYVFMVLDSGLNNLQTFQAMPFERINYAMATTDTAFLLSTYNGIRHTDFVSRKYLPDQDLASPSPDLHLQNFDIPDTVLVSDWSDPQWYFGESSFEVENLSNDTIQDFRLECLWIPFLGFCTNYERVWLYENVSLLPGETRTFILDAFDAALEIGHHSPFCFWIESANGFPDPNPNDNYACDAAQIVTGMRDLQYEQVVISPNPASSIFTITGQVDFSDVVQVQIYSLQGRLEKSIHHVDPNESIRIDDLPTGMHIVHAITNSGKRGLSKLIIQR